MKLWLAWFSIVVFAIAIVVLCAPQKVRADDRPLLVCENGYCTLPADVLLRILRRATGADCT